MIDQLTRPVDAIELLAKLGASPWLVRHYQLVVEAAVAPTTMVGRVLAARFDRDEVLLGAAISRAGGSSIRARPPRRQRQSDRGRSQGGAGARVIAIGGRAR